MLRLMQGVIVIAARALGNPAAVMAQQGWRESAAVEEENHLIIGLQMLAHTAN
ncbi:hypothetical protein D3C86_1909490 [compost metagenome]